MDILTSGGPLGYISLPKSQTREKIDELLIKYGNLGPRNAGLPLSFETPYSSRTMLWLLYRNRPGKWRLREKSRRAGLWMWNFGDGSLLAFK